MRAVGFALILTLCGVAMAEEDECGCQSVALDHAYPQHLAPTANSLWGMATTEMDKLGMRAKDFGITYKGGIQQALVGTHVVVVNFTSTSNVDGPSCLEISFEITDSDECAITANDTLAALYPDWTHKCHASSLCVNTDGSFDCACPADSGTVGALFSGSVKAAGSAEYELAPGVCHGFESTEFCCGQPNLAKYQPPYERQITCNTPECVANCKADFTCESPCDAIGRAHSKRAKALADRANREGGDSAPVEAWRKLADFGQLSTAWTDELECTASDAGFTVQCRDGWAPEEEYEDRLPVPYVWADRRADVDAAYTIPALENVELRCFDLSKRLYCDPLEPMQCPCGCHCVDAPEYRRLTGEDVPLGTAYYCLPDDGFMSVEPADFPTELEAFLGLPHNHLDAPRLGGKNRNKRNDTHVCVDRTPPAIMFQKDADVLRQGDPVYQPPSAVFEDRNVDTNLRRSMEMRMSPELWGEQGHLVQVGDFAVTFTAVTPWLDEAQRQIKVEHAVTVLDVDECSYDGPVEQFQHKCFKREHDDPRMADGVCTNVVMVDDVGPGYTCSCPEGYAGNAFADELAFNIHAQGKQALQDAHAAAGAAAAIKGDDARNMNSWLQHTRGFPGFADNELSNNSSALYCVDVRQPEFGCGPDGCNTIELEAASAKALTIKHSGEPSELTRDMLQEDTPDLACESKWHFVRKILDDKEAVQRYCGPNFEHCLTATDVLVDGDKDYQMSIRLLGLEELFTDDSITSHCSRTCSSQGNEELFVDDGDGDGANSWFCDTLRFRALFSVTDLAGNTANTSLDIAVRPMNMTKVLGAPSASADDLLGRTEFVARFFPEWLTNVVLVVVGLALFVVLYVNMPNLIVAANVCQLLLVPFTLAEDRDSFERAVRAVLWVQSGGAASGWTNHELDTKIEEEWQNFQMSR